MPGCELQHGSVRPYPILASPASPGNTWASPVAELADPWTAQHQATLAHRRGHPRRRAAGAGPHQRLALCERVLATLIVLRLQLPHQALAVLLGVDRATITRAIGQIRPLLAAPGASPWPASPRCGCRPWRMWSPTRRPTAWSCAWTAPRPRSAGPAPTDPAGAFVSGKRKQNTLKPTVVSDGQGRTLWAGAVRPGRMHDQTAVKTEGIAVGP
jgi:Helix-turn-helix of DDE superfamily endonuclease